MTLRGVNFGVLLPVFVGNSYNPGKVKKYSQIDYAFPLNDSFSWEQQVGMTKQAEKLGYDSVWVSDHFMLGKANFEAWVTASALAAQTSKVKVGTFMSCDAYRNPALVAKMATNLGIISGGRFILGYGSGWYKPEFDAYGFPFPPLKGRVEKMKEGLRIIKGMLEKPVFSYSGDHYRVAEVENEPRPKKKVPLIIGGGGKRTLKAVAEFADGWDIGPDPTPERYRDLVGRLKEEMRKRGRKYDEITRSIHFTLVLGRDKEELRKKKRVLLNAVKDIDLSNAYRSGPGNFDIEKTLIGTPSEVKQKLKAYEEAGCQRFIMVFMDYPRYDSPSLLAETLMD